MNATMYPQVTAMAATANASNYTSLNLPHNFWVIWNLGLPDASFVWICLC